MALGTLTIDIAANIARLTSDLGRAVRLSEQRAEEMRQTWERASQLVGATVSAVGTGAFAVWIKSSIDAMAQLEQLATLANASTADFQKMAFGAAQVGIQQDQLASILKDVNDRVGEFMQNGGGEMAEFFERIAPDIGVTVEQFRNLSGPQALQLYVSSLEKANLTQQEMTFYLESMADDATALLPLLRNGGEGMRQFAEQAEALGLILDTETIAQAGEFNQQLTVLEAVTGNAGQRIASEMLPSLQNMTGLLIEVSKDAQAASVTAEAFGGVLKTVATVGIAVGSTLASVGRGIGAVAAAGVAAAQGEFAQAGEILRMVTADNEKSAADAEERIRKLWAGEYKAAGVQAAAVGKTLSDSNESMSATGRTYLKTLQQQLEKQQDNNNAIKEAERWIRDHAEATETDKAKILEAAKAIEAQKKANEAGKKAKNDTASATKKQTEAIQSQIAALQLQAATLGMTTAEATLYKLSLEGASKAQLEQASRELKAVEAFEKQKKALEERAELVKQVAQVDEASWSDASRALLSYQQQVETLRAGVLAGVISEEDAERTIAGLEAQAEKAEETADQITVFMDQAARNSQTAFANFLFDPFKAGAEGMLSGFLDMVRRMAAEAAAADIASSLFGAVGTNGKRSGGLLQAGIGAVGNWFGGWFANAKGNAFAGGKVVPFADGGAFTNSIVSSPTLFPMASGTGLMGEAGPEAIMPLTRTATGALGVRALTDMPTMQKSEPQAPIINIIEDASRAGQVSSRREDERWVVDVVVANLYQGGSVWQAISGMAGVDRKGT